MDAEPSDVCLTHSARRRQGADRVVFLESAGGVEYYKTEGVGRILVAPGVGIVAFFAAGFSRRIFSMDPVNDPTRDVPRARGYYIRKECTIAAGGAKSK